MDNQFSLAKTWNLLRHLLNPEDTKAVHRQNMNEILHAYKGTEQEFLKEVELKYISQAPPCAHPEYLGVPNTDHYEEFSEAEIRAGLHKLNIESAPGPDAITNKTLRNLDDTSIVKLTNFMNECWRLGHVLQQPYTRAWQAPTA